jgi:hypothetical protein
MLYTQQIRAYILNFDLCDDWKPLDLASDTDDDLTVKPTNVDDTTMSSTGRPKRKTASEAAAKISTQAIQDRSSGKRQRLEKGIHL